MAEQLSRADGIERLLALNGEEVPYVYSAFDGGVVGVWHYADAKWAALLSAGSVSRAYTLTVHLEDDGTYWFLDETEDSESKVDLRRLKAGYRKDFFRGEVHRASFNRTITLAASDHGRTGNTYGWDFSTEEMKRPVRETLEAAGWRPRKRSLWDRMFGRA